jgi:serine/threonine protein kinase
MARTGAFAAPPGFRDSPARAVNPGEVVASTYAIRDELARTDNGVVYEARDMMLDRLVALKLAWRDPGTPSLIIEARRCSAVRDPCAVAIHGMGNHNGMEFVVGERVVGRLLRELVDRQPPLAPDVYLARLRSLVGAVARAHDCGIAVGDISGATVLVDEQSRIVLGRLSLSQVPAFGPIGQILAPEVVRGEVDPASPTAAEAIDLYGLGCIAIELAVGAPPFSGTDAPTELRGHGWEPPPRLADVRPDLPVELSDLTEWLLAKHAGGRPRSAADVLHQLDAIAERAGTKARPLRVLVVDDDTARARWMWSLARRAHAAALVETASEGTDAAHKLNRDLPDLVFIDAGLRGVMNALELCMYARGLPTDHNPQLVVVGDIPDRDRVVLADAAVPCIPDDAGLASAILDRVRLAVGEPPRRRRPRRTVSG